MNTSGDSLPAKWRDFDRSLPPVLEYTGEFGPEIVLFLPALNWLSAIGLLKNRRVSSYRGMRCFYDELDCLEVIEKSGDRVYVPAAERAVWLPVKNEHDFDGTRRRSPEHLYPNLREKFAKLPLLPQIGSPERPLLIVHNKYNQEWGGGAVNYIDIEHLRMLFGFLSRDFTVVYIRHGIAAESHDYVADRNDSLPFDDRSVLLAHTGVLCFDDLYALHREQGGTQDLNTFKNVLYSRCHRFISVQGGGAHQMALYSGSLLVVLHRRGSEESWAYANGYYQFMAAIPPHLALCRNQEDLLRALPLFVGSTVAEDRIFLRTGSEKRLSELSPSTITQRQ